MKLKFKNTNINYTVKKTTNKERLASNDSWLMVDFNVDNEEFSYHNCRESLSLGKIIEACTVIRKLYDELVAVKKKITFIKNYFIIYINNTPEEILEFVNLSRNIA